jgi:3-keto-5-aminohexanoate cleavage enzyme
MNATVQHPPVSNISHSQHTALTTKDQHSKILYSPEEIVEAAIESHRADTAIAHLYVRNPSTGKAAQDPELFKKVIRLIRKECDILINTTTDGSSGMCYVERIEII